MSHRVSVHAPERYARWRRAVASAGRAALAAAKSPPAQVTVVLTDDRTLRRLNRRFASLDRATDVLSFPAEAPPRAARYLGDVVISVPRARRQAASRGHPVRSELSLLAVHGVLHLLGYDHARPLQRRRMGALHARAMERLGIRLGADPLAP
ncbi:MAG: rRNA maturation RNase YbeY [Anaerolineales bacterium]